MGDELDAVALGLKRGRRGAVTVVVLVLLGLVGFLLVPAREEGDAVPPTPAVTSEEVVAPLPSPPVSKRSRATRGVPRTSPAAATRREETVAPRETDIALPPAVAVPARDEAPAPTERDEAATAVSVVTERDERDGAATPLPVAPRDEAVSPAAGDEAVALAPRAQEESVGPPPAPPAEEEDARDGNGEAIARAIASAKRAAVRECFERELKQTPKLAGTVVVELDLAPPSTVREVRVSDDLERPSFTRCVVQTMQDVRFSALDEEVSVRVPYALTPGRK
jgi:hypothetical protein